MIKRKYSGISFLMLFMLISGCESVNSKTDIRIEKPETEITIAWWGNENRNDYMHELLELYEQQNPQISFVPISLAEEDYEEYLAVTAAAGESPDVMQMNEKPLTVYERNDTLADWKDTHGLGMEPEVSIDGRLMDTGKRGNIQAGIPVSVSIPYMVYCPLLLQDADIMLPERLNWKAFLDICRLVSRKTDRPVLSYDHYSCSLLLTWMEQRGEPLFREGEPVFTADGQTHITEYFLFCKEMFSSGAMWPLVSGGEPKEKPAVFYFEGQEAVHSLDKEIGSSVISLPVYEQKEMQTRITPQLYYSLSAQINEGKKKAAAEFIVWLLNNETAVRRTGLEKGIPASHNARRFLVQDTFTSRPEKDLLQLYEQVEGREGIYTSVVQHREEINEVYGNIIGRLYRGECSPQDAAAEFEQEIMKLFDKSGEQKIRSGDESREKTG